MRTIILVVSANIVLVQAISHAESVNFDAPGGLGAVNYSGQGAVVDPGHNYWNPIKQNGTTAAATNSDGTTVGMVTLTDRSPSSYGAQGAQGTPAGLEAPFLLENNGTTITESLNNLPADTYNLYLYGKNDDGGDADRGATFTVSVGGTSYGTQSTVNSVTSSFTQGNDYVKFANVVVGAGGTITLTYTANTAANSHHNPQNEGDFNGLQLISSASDTNVTPIVAPQVFIPTSNTNEIVVAMTTPQQFGAKGDGLTDDSAAFQAAINAVYKNGGNGGGVVYVPAGNYAFYNPITIQSGVTLEGDWTDWTKGTNGCVGTTFKVYCGAGQTNGTPFISMMDSSTCLRGINIWYPNQNPNNITGYPFTIQINGDCVVKNVVLINSYQGIQIGGQNSEWILSTVIGTPLLTGFSTGSAVADISHTEDVRFSPNVWAESGLSNAPTAGGPYATWMRTYGTGFQMFRLDGMMNMDTRISGYNIGLDFEQNSNGVASAAFYGGWATNCATAAFFQYANNSAIPQFARFILDGDVAISHTNTATDEELQFNDCQITGKSGVAVIEAGNSWQSSMDFQNCAIAGTMQLNGPGIFNLVNCSLNANTQCVMSASATRAAFTGCTFSPAQNIVNNGSTLNLIIDSRQAISNAMPIVDWTNILNNYVSCRPAKTNLFVSSSYGATGNGTTDDTAAIQNALSAAGANGGGIVYLLPGKYKVSNTLDVPSGVELFGGYEVRHNGHTTSDGYQKGAVLEIYGGQGTTNGPPAITLEAGAGLVGMTMNYPNQNTNCIPFPPTIQGRGGNIYVIGSVCPSSYYFADLASYTCTNHFIDMMDGNATLVGVSSGNGSSGTIVDCEFTGYESSIAESNFVSYPFGNCTELLVKDFSIEEENFMHCSSQNGIGPTVTTISAICDATYQGFIFDGPGPSIVNIVNPDWLVIIPSGNTIYTNSAAIITATNYQGTVRVFDSPLHTSANLGYEINGGDIGLEMVHGWQYSNPLNISINGGAFHLINAGFFEANPVITFGPNAGIAGITNDFVGCYCQNGFTYNNLYAANPINLGNDYALFGYDVIGGPPDLALDRPVTASSVDGYPAANAVDGNLDTRWSSAYSDPQWIYVDLGTNYNITTVELVWEAACGNAYQIQVSTNAATWTTLFSTNNDSSPAVNDYKTEYITGLSGMGRYVRMYGTQRNPVNGVYYGYSLWEFEVFGTLANTNLPPLSIHVNASASPVLFLSWPDNGTGQLSSQPPLYYAAGLTLPIIWQAVTNVPVFSNGQWIISFPIGSSRQGYYQLQ